MNRKQATAIAWGLTVLIVGGCSTAPEKSPQDEGAVAPEDVEVTDVSIQAAEGGAAAAMTEGAMQGRDWAGSPLEDPDSPLYTKTVYFAFDSSEVDAQYHDVVAAHAEYLASNPSQTLRVEGHGDERGSREYNIGLGERRAEAVTRLLEAGGAAASQLTTISYGEERPVASGENEEAWALNRRVELVY